MKLVIGGAFQGKYYYARKTFNIQDGWVDGNTCSWDEIFECRGLLHFHDYVRRRMQAGKEVDGLAGELLEKNPDICILTNEVGYGVVPWKPLTGNTGKLWAGSVRSWRHSPGKSIG